MEFFNKIGEKISSGASAVSNSTKKMAEIAKLNNKISHAHDEIDAKYTEIGKIVKLELIDSINHEEVKRLSDEIDALNAEVNESKETINKLKGLKYCVNCGTQLGGDDVFCSNCGTKQPEPAPEAEPCVAPVCESTVSGENAAESVVETMEQESQPIVNEETAVPEVQPVEQETETAEKETADVEVKETKDEEIPVAEAEVVEAVSGQPAVSESAVEEKKYIFCSECGNKEEAGVKFCSECGTKMD